MAQVIPYQRRNAGAEFFQTIGPLAGAIAGGFIGKSPQAAAAGAAVGGTLGNVAGGLLAQPPAPQPVQTQQNDMTALQRRQLQLNPTVTLNTLKQAEMAATQLPEDQRQAYLPTLTRARMLAEAQQNQYGMA